MYNPSSHYQQSFVRAFETLLRQQYAEERHTDDDTPTTTTTTAATMPFYQYPLFFDAAEDSNTATNPNPNPTPNPVVLLGVTLIFRKKRPQAHFINNTPGLDRLKPTAPSALLGAPSVTDVDNLAKFVLDALNTIVYADDKQIITLSAVKLLDDDGVCEGSTTVELSAIRSEQDLSIPLLE